MNEWVPQQIANDQRYEAMFVFLHLVFSFDSLCDVPARGGNAIIDMWLRDNDTTATKG